MVKIETKTVKLSEIRLNPDNPRRISNKDMERLVKSLQEFPDMLREKP
jgi:ParB-like chromosome segregation protein Spo0J